jgi:hypothetical protein
MRIVRCTIETAHELYEQNGNEASVRTATYLWELLSSQKKGGLQDDLMQDPRPWSPEGDAILLSQPEFKHLRC